MTGSVRNIDGATCGSSRQTSGVAEVRARTRRSRARAQHSFSTITKSLAMRPMSPGKACGVHSAVVGSFDGGLELYGPGGDSEGSGTD